MMIKILYDNKDTAKEDKKITTPITPPTTPIEDNKPLEDNKPCSIASKKLSLLETIKQLEEEQIEDPVKEVKNISPHGFRFFVKNYIEQVVKTGTSKQKIYNSYNDYCNDNYIKPLDMKQFNKKMEERGVVSYKNSIMHYRCISHYKSKKDLENTI